MSSRRYELTHSDWKHINNRIRNVFKLRTDNEEDFTTNIGCGSNMEAKMLKLIKDTKGKDNDRLYSATFNGELSTIKEIFNEHKIDKIKIDNVARVATYRDQLDVIRYILSISKINNKLVITKAVEYSAVKILKFMLSRHPEVDYSSLYETAIIDNKVESCLTLIKEDPNVDLLKLVNFASKGYSSKRSVVFPAILELMLSNIRDNIAMSEGKNDFNSVLRNIIK